MDIELKKMDLKDVEEMVRWEKNEDPLFDDYNFPPYSKREQKLWFASKTRYGRRCFTILVDEVVAGYIAVRKINPLTKAAEMGIIIRPSYQNQGIGRLAIKAMLHWFFEDLGYKKMTLYVGKYNKRAFGCYRSIGFEPIEELMMPFNNQVVDVDDPQYAEIAPYFAVKGGKMQTQYYRMALVDTRR